MNDASLTPRPDYLETQDLAIFQQNAQYAEQLGALQYQNTGLQQKLEQFDQIVDVLQQRRAQLVLEVEFYRERQRAFADCQRREMEEILRLKSESLHVMYSDVQTAFLDEIRAIHEQIAQQNDILYTKAYQDVLVDIREQYDREHKALEERNAMLELQLADKRKCSRCQRLESRLHDLRQQLQNEAERGRALSERIDAAIIAIK